MAYEIIRWPVSASPNSFSSRPRVQPLSRDQSDRANLSESYERYFAKILDVQTPVATNKSAVSTNGRDSSRASALDTLRNEIEQLAVLDRSTGGGSLSDRARHTTIEMLIAIAESGRRVMSNQVVSDDSWTPRELAQFLATNAV